MNLKTVPSPKVQPSLGVPFSDSFISAATAPHPTPKSTNLEHLQKSQLP